MNWRQQFLTTPALVVSCVCFTWPLQANSQQSDGFTCDQIFEQARSTRNCAGYQNYLEQCPDDLFASPAHAFLIKNCKAELSDNHIQIAPNQPGAEDQKGQSTAENSEPNLPVTSQTPDLECPVEQHDGTIKEAKLSEYLSDLRALNLEEETDMLLFHPLLDYTSFLRAGCTDEEFLSGYLGAVSEVKLPTENIWGITPGEVSDKLVSLGMQLYIIGDTQALLSIVENLKRRKSAGDALAANALGNLFWLGTLVEDYQWTVNWFKSIDIITRELENKDLGLNLKPNDTFRELQKQLDKDRKKNLLFAAQSGYAPAHVGLMGFESIYVLELCEAFPDSDLHRRIWHSGDGEKVVRELFDWAVAELNKGPTAADTLGAIEGIFMAVAHAKTNCGYSVFDPTGDFEVVSDGAALAAYYAVLTPYFVDFKPQTKLAFGTMVDWGAITTDHTIEEKHHMSANFLLSAGMWSAAIGFETFDFYMKHLSERISRGTISDAQRTLKKYGFYNGQIDGVPGKQFKFAVVAAEQQCTHDTAKMYPEYCWMSTRAIDIRYSDWFRALLPDSDEIERNR